MRNSKLSILFCILLAILLPGCKSKYTADQYVGEQITTMKNSAPESFASLLDDGIAKSNETYVLQFPEELKEPYLEFLQSSFQTIQFEVAKAKENDDGSYSVQITYTPVNIGETLSSKNTELTSSLESSSLTEAVSSVLKEDCKILADSPVYNDEIISTVKLTQNADGYSIDEDSMFTFLSQALYGYMEPYNIVCELFDAQDFLTAYLDASFKGDVVQFAKHTGRTEEEALAWYEADVFDPPSDLSFAYVSRYQEALKGIMKQCQYTVGIPQKESGIYSYTVDVTVIPNNSLLNAFQEFEQGTYYSIDEASLGLVQAMEKYSASPDYGTETVLNVPINMNSLLNAGNDDSELSNLAATILPLPE